MALKPWYKIEGLNPPEGLRDGKPVIMSAEAKTPEIPRHRLFEWNASTVSQYGKLLLPFPTKNR